MTTADHASTEKWFQFRHGVTAASYAHEVLLKVEDNLQSSNISSAKNLYAKRCMYNLPTYSAALNWGRLTKSVLSNVILERTVQSKNSFHVNLQVHI